MTSKTVVFQSTNEKFTILSKLQRDDLIASKLYIAERQSNGEKVLLKQYINENHKTHGVDTFVLRELANLRSLEHKNIVKFYDAEITGPDTIYAAFEYLEHSLFDYMDIRGQLSIEEVRNVMKQLLEGLQAIHLNRIIHRDISPSSVVTNDFETFKIGSFGSSRPKLSHDVKYTPGTTSIWYGAPELTLANDIYNEKVDVWSLGCILYELITGEHLFQCGRDEFEFRLRIVFGEGMDLYDIVFGNQQLDVRSRKCLLDESEKTMWKPAIDLLSKMMEPDVKKRYNVKQALGHPFFHC